MTIDDGIVRLVIGRRTAEKVLTRLQMSGTKKA